MAARWDDDKAKKERKRRREPRKSINLIFNLKILIIGNSEKSQRIE